VIYQTNFTASYAAGRWAQLNDPDLLKLRPYWQYVHNDTVQHPRPLHQAWGRKPVVLPPDDPWWRTHFPPNGWGCRCRVVAVRADEYRGAPAPDDGTWTKVDRWGEAHDIPKGIDYGWDYAPGASLRPRNLSQQVMAEWRAAKADAWETLTRGNWQSLGRPAAIPADTTTLAPGPRLTTQAEVVDALRSQLGGESKVYRVGGDYAYPLMVDAEALGSHIDPARSVYLPYLETLIQEPFEVWAMIQQHKGTGQTAFRVRLVKRIETGDKKGLLLVAQAHKGQLESWTFMPTSDLKYLNRQREGVLVYARE